MDEDQRQINDDSILIHRGRLIHDLIDQMHAVDDEKCGKQPDRCWYWQEKNIYYLPIRYRKHNLEIFRDNYSIHCIDLDAVKECLEDAARCVSEGLYDEAIKDVLLLPCGNPDRPIRQRPTPLFD